VLSLACAFTALYFAPSFATIAQDAPAKKPAAPETPAYDEKADAAVDIAAALARAKSENRRVLIQWGANWCDWCLRLHGLAKNDKEISRKLLYEYDVVRVDVGHFDKHMELAEKYEARLKDSGIPYLTVLDEGGNLLANQETGVFEIKESPAHDPKKVLEFLTKHQAEYLKATELRDAALAEAKASKKKVFLHFGAPWCGWCHRLENWMARPEIAAVLSKEFVDRKIDNDRTVGGQDLMLSYCEKQQGIPWFAFVDGDGKVLATSTDEKGNNTGFPSADEEIAHFVKMLESTCTTITKAEIAMLRDSLVGEREKTKR
jgi:thioredoxin-related protein